MESLILIVKKNPDQLFILNLRTCRGPYLPIICNDFSSPCLLQVTTAQGTSLNPHIWKIFRTLAHISP